ncbi:MAG: tyrosine-type recombinase/integrase, partial [Pseudomonadota bacterium]
RQALTEWFVLNNALQEEAAEDVLLVDVIRIYYEEHGSKIKGHDTARLNLQLWLQFFPTDATVTSATKPKEIDRFIAFLSNDGERSASYINRILSTGKAAINRAWKQGMITSAPFIKTLPIKKAEPKGRPLSLDEVRYFYHTATAPQLKAFILWSLGTAGRPDAILDLHSSFIDLEHDIVPLNPPKREQTKKYRPTVKLPATLKPLIEDGYQVTYRGKRIISIKKAWRNHRQTCGFDGQVNPYSLRHTIARHLRASGVPAWEVSAQLGHKRKDLSITEIYAPFDPSYLSNAVSAIDLYLKDVLVSPEERPLIEREKSCPNHVPSGEDENGQGLDFIGAGDEIRTHDPNLG